MTRKSNSIVSEMKSIIEKLNPETGSIQQEIKNTENKIKMIENKIAELRANGQGFKKIESVEDELKKTTSKLDKLQEIQNYLFNLSGKEREEVIGLDIRNQVESISEKLQEDKEIDEILNSSGKLRNEFSKTNQKESGISGVNNSASEEDRQIENILSNAGLLKKRK